MEREALARLLARTARVLVDNSIWTVTRAVNSRVTKFVGSLISRDRKQPIFEMLPPQRRTLREEGLLGSGHRSVVVSLPTWVAYLAPTRALVNQIALRLRRDFAPLGSIVEKVSPALEIDGLEAGMLTDKDEARQFRILVTTPEKLDLMLRGGWEEKIALRTVPPAHAVHPQRRRDRALAVTRQQQEHRVRRRLEPERSRDRDCSPGAG